MTWKILTWKNWNEGIDMNELTWMSWNEWIEMNELTWKNWNAWLETHELTWMNWNQWIDKSELEWVTWHDWLEMEELKRMNWTKWMKWINSNEWIDMKEVKHMNWNEWIEMNDLATSSWKSAPRPLLSCDVYVNRALATVSCIFCRPHLEKVLRDRQFFTISLAAVSCTFCLPLSGLRRETGETETLQRGHTGFRARVCFQPWIHAFPLNYFMMMWLTWWCGWHDGATAGCENRSKFGSFLTKLPLITLWKIMQNYTTLYNIKHHCITLYHII